MSRVIVDSGAKELTVRARIIRANGEIEDQGVVAYWHRSFWRRLTHRIKHGLHECRVRRALCTCDEEKVN